MWRGAGGRELRIPALALSHINDDRGCDWALAERLLDPILDQLILQSARPSYVLNVNLPNFEADGGPYIHVVPLGKRALGTPMLKVGKIAGPAFMPIPPLSAPR